VSDVAVGRRSIAYVISILSFTSPVDMYCVPILVFKRTRDFEIAQSESHAKPDIDKTWPNFKTHFSVARRNLQTVCGPTLQQAGFHQTNSVTESVRDDIKPIEHNLLQAFTTSLAELEERTICHNEENIPPFHSANVSTTSSITTTSALVDVVNVLKDLKTEVQLLKQQQTGNKFQNGDNNGNNKNGRVKNRVFVLDPQPHRSRHNTMFYCWSHGAGSHSSAECNNRKPSHKHAATFQNKMDDCTCYYQPINSNDTNESNTCYSTISNLVQTNLSTNDQLTSSSTHIAVSTKSPIHTKADSGTTDHYWRESDYDC